MATLSGNRCDCGSVMLWKTADRLSAVVTIDPGLIDTRDIPKPRPWTDYLDEDDIAVMNEDSDA